jgi:hypothetical protein
MKNSQISEIYFVLNSPFRYYMLMVLSLFGGWSIAQDIMAISNKEILAKDISGVYIIIILLSMIGFYGVRKNAIKKAALLQSELDKN